MNLISRIAEKLDSVAGQLEAEPSKSSWTQIVHASISSLAGEYTSCKKIGLGPVSGVHNVQATLEVFGKPAGTRSAFMFDYCWLTWCDLRDDDKFGYLLSCDLAVETEWHSHDTYRSESDALHHDFRKLVISRAERKVFVFIDYGHVGNETVEKFKLQAECFASSSGKSNYLVSYYLNKQFHHTTFLA